jgi:hypothetical protein
LRAPNAATGLAPADSISWQLHEHSYQNGRDSRPLPSPFPRAEGVFLLRQAALQRPRAFNRRFRPLARDDWNNKPAPILRTGTRRPSHPGRSIPCSTHRRSNKDRFHKSRRRQHPLVCIASLEAELIGGISSRTFSKASFRPKQDLARMEPVLFACDPLRSSNFVARRSTARRRKSRRFVKRLPDYAPIRWVLFKKEAQPLNRRLRREPKTALRADGLSTVSARLPFAQTSPMDYSSSTQMIRVPSLKSAVHGNSSDIP